MTEKQDIEYKESWRDDYLKWVCGFANAQGGRIYIGVNDNGEVVGVSNAKRLLEDIPNKIKDTMGIIADVNLLKKKGKEYIDIRVKPSSYPVSYHGEYHVRSGSTKQQLRGTALTEFLIEKTGCKWDAVPVDEIKVKDLDSESLEIFRNAAIINKRVSKKDLNISNLELLRRLDLVTPNGKLKRAAVMLFYSRPGTIVTGCYVKIGKFDSGSHLRYQDVLEGSLFYIADRVLDLIYTKYLAAEISYDPDIRVETYPFPREGVREAIYNALAHNNYLASVPIQIRIDDNTMSISNSCILPSGWTADTLMKPHKSIPFNPSIANVFYRAGYIEAWGRGIKQIVDTCRNIGAPDPEFTLLGDDLTVRFTAVKSSFPARSHAGSLSHTTDSEKRKTACNTAPSSGKKGKVKSIEDEVITLISENNTISRAQIAEQLGVSVKTVQRVISNLRAKNRIVRKDGNRYGYWVINKEMT